jgi:hypothetical protein
LGWVFEARLGAFFGRAAYSEIASVREELGGRGIGTVERRSESAQRSDGKRRGVVFW